VVASPDPSASLQYLYGVAAISPIDIWAVGVYDPTPSSGWTLTLHWDGNQWSQVPSPNPRPTGTNIFLAVTAISTNDVWAVGYTYSGAGWRTLAEHWDGIQWSVIPTPNPDINENQLKGVSAVSSSDVWAVGYYATTSAYQTLVEHWNGIEWSVIPSANVGTASNQLYAVSALSANEVWAVGYHGGALTLVEHWDGSQWSIIPTSDPAGAYNNFLFGVAAITSNDVWIVGSYQDHTAASSTLVYHWNGSQLSIVPSPNVGDGVNHLLDIVAISSTDVWAVGYHCCASSAPSGTLTMHWNGSEWSIVPSPSPNPGQYNNTLEGVAALSSGDVWAAGYLQSCPGGPCSWQTLTEHYSSPCQTQTPTDTPTSTPTSTPTPSGLLVGHVTWQGRPAQPSPLQSLPITMTLRPSGGGSASEYMGLNTDPSGYFTVSVDSLSGSYDWRVKGPNGSTANSGLPGFLAVAGTVSLPGEGTTQAEMGLQKAGDANNDNLVAAQDFTIMKNTFGKSIGDPGYDGRADFNGDGLVNIADFTLLKVNFGTGGVGP
jgi:hypothetical protein